MSSLRQRRQRRALELLESVHLKGSLAAQGELRFSVTETEVSPLFRPGDELDVVACRSRDLKRGDLVLLSGLPAQLHRVVRRTEQGLITRADSVGAVEQLCQEERLVGKIARRRRDGRVRRIDHPLLRLKSAFSGVRRLWRGRRVGALQPARRPTI